jgi:hypothetical protein
MKRTIIGAMLCGLCLSSGIAHATDDKVYSGASCVKEGTSGSAYVDAQGRIWNSSPSEWLNLECTIERDDTGGSLDDARLAAFDTNYYGDITCTLYGWDREGWGVNGTSTRSTGGSSWYDQVLDFDGLNWAGNDWYNVIRCSVPPTYNGNWSGIASYKVME